MATTQQTQHQEHELAAPSKTIGGTTAKADGAGSKAGGILIKTGIKAGMFGSSGGDFNLPSIEELQKLYG
jgi:hypothetical protein